MKSLSVPAIGQEVSGLWLVASEFFIEYMTSPNTPHRAQPALLKNWFHKDVVSQVIWFHCFNVYFFQVFTSEVCMPEVKPLHRRRRTPKKRSLLLQDITAEVNHGGGGGGGADFRAGPY